MTDLTHRSNRAGALLGSGQDRAARALWDGVAAYVARAPSEFDVRAHRLLPIASELRTAGGSADRQHAIEALDRLVRVRAAKSALAAVRAALGDEHDIVLFKGLSVASRYARPELRQFGDLDLLVSNPRQAQRALMAAGFVPTGDADDHHYQGLQHLRPLVHPEHGNFPIEVHDHVSWVPWSAPPSAEQIIADSQPSNVGVNGIREPHPAQHALIVAAHSVSELPLRAAGDLLDFELLASEVTPRELADAAEAWGLERLLALYRGASRAIWFDQPAPTFVKLFAPSLLRACETTVLERHLRIWVCPAWVRAPRDVPRGVARAVLNDLSPAESETWGDKASRLWLSGRHLRRTLSEHGSALGPDGIRARHQRRRQDERRPLSGG